MEGLLMVRPEDIELILTTCDLFGVPEGYGVKRRSRSEKLPSIMNPVKFLSIVRVFPLVFL
jgi:hypothetical protein